MLARGLQTNSPQRDEEKALLAVSIMRQRQVVDLTAEIALVAAKLGYTLKLALADSVILATARKYGATLWTQDNDFEDLDEVRYVPRKDG